MVTFLKSKDGEITAQINNSFVHSSYSPLKEAARFCAMQKIENAKTIIIIAPALNYISSIIKKNNEKCKIISIYFFSDFFKKDDNKSDAKFLFKSNIDELKTFLNKHLKELDVEGLRIIGWSPVKKIEPLKFNNINIYLKQHISELHGNITTTSGFGKKFFSNFTKNFLFINDYSAINKTNKAIIITGSGPSLKKDISFIRKNRNRFFILSLPSSLTFLKYSKIKPDCIVSTDPGFFAKNHLQGFENIPLIIPFYASIPISFYKAKIIPFLSSYFLESIIINNSYPFMKIPSNGTVAGSALFLSLILTSSYIFFSGLDFSYIDCLSHVRPHSYDNLLDSKAKRNKTINTIYFKRNIIFSEKNKYNRRETHSLKVYQNWFSSISNRLQNKCFFINHYSTPPGYFSSLNYNEILKLTTTTKKEIKIVSTKSSQANREEVFKNYLYKEINNFKKQQKEISTFDNTEYIFKLLNNKYFSNLYLPELLEFKKHYLDLSYIEAKEKADNLIENLIQFFEKYINYVK